MLSPRGHDKRRGCYCAPENMNTFRTAKVARARGSSCTVSPPEQTSFELREKGETKANLEFQVTNDISSTTPSQHDRHRRTSGTKFLRIACFYLTLEKGPLYSPPRELPSNRKDHHGIRMNNVGDCSLPFAPSVSASVSGSSRLTLVADPPQLATSLLAPGATYMPPAPTNVWSGHTR